MYALKRNILIFAKMEDAGRYSTVAHSPPLDRGAQYSTRPWRTVPPLDRGAQYLHSTVAHSTSTRPWRTVPPLDRGAQYLHSTVAHSTSTQPWRTVLKISAPAK